MFNNVEQVNKLSFLFIVIISLNSCKVKTPNQTLNNKREGLWTESYAIDSAHYKSIGTYKKDDLIKKWCYYLNGKLIKKERYHDAYCKTKFFHQNRKPQAKGKTRLDQNEKEIHWYYSGIWKFYNSEGKLTSTRTYKNGDLIKETIKK